MGRRSAPQAALGHVTNSLTRVCLNSAADACAGATRRRKAAFRHGPGRLPCRDAATPTAFRKKVRARRRSRNVGWECRAQHSKSPFFAAIAAKTSLLRISPSRCAARCQRNRHAYHRYARTQKHRPIKKRRESREGNAREFRPSLLHRPIRRNIVGRMALRRAAIAHANAGGHLCAALRRRVRDERHH